MAEIKIENVTKKFGDFVAVDNVSLHVEDQEFMVLLGPSGCGKTTLLRAVAGLGMADSGRISIGGRDVTYMPPRKRGISMVFQSYAIFPHMNVYDNIAFGLKMNNVAKPETERRVREAAELLHIEEMLDRYPSKMSGGQRQRVAVAWAIAMKSQVLLMDEPLSNLDALLRLEMRAELKRLLTETNVPHAENISYFGEYGGKYGTERRGSDEAQMVYQFPLGPLTLHTFLSGDTTRLTEWVGGLPELPPGTTFFNFTASHDGIGVRPAEGLLTAEEVGRLVETALAHGGQVSYKANADGSRSPYELNITWYDALNDPARPAAALDVARFLASQAIMLALAGVPGIYVHSHLLRVYQEQFGAHPGAYQRVLRLGAGTFALLRTADDGHSVLCVNNVTAEGVRVAIDLAEHRLSPVGQCVDALSGEPIGAQDGVLNCLFRPYQTRWVVL